MREVRFQVYSFDELSDDARRKAVERMRQSCVEHNSDWIWQDARETTSAIEEMTGIVCDIELSSQGWYINRVHMRYESPYYDKDDVEAWYGFLNKMKTDFAENVWCDKELCDILKNYTFNDCCSFERNIASLLLSFCEKVYDLELTYYDDDKVIEFVETGDYEFYEDGTPFFE